MKILQLTFSNACGIISHGCKLPEVIFSIEVSNNNIFSQIVIVKKFIFILEIIQHFFKL